MQQTDFQKLFSWLRLYSELTICGFIDNIKTPCWLSPVLSLQSIAQGFATFLFTAFRLSPALGAEVWFLVSKKPLDVEWWASRKKLAVGRTIEVYYGMLICQDLCSQMVIYFRQGEVWNT